MRRYDHRVRNLIVESGNPDLFPDLKIPRSTIRDWMRKGKTEVVTHRSLNFDYQKLLIENQELRSQLEEANAKFDLLMKTVRIFGIQIQYLRLPSKIAKEALIKIVQEVSLIIGLQATLSTIQLSMARYKAWVRRQKKCQLQDFESCPRIIPHKILPSEIRKIKEYVESPKFKHFSISSLAIYARRLGEVVVSTPSWYKIIKDHGMIRPGKRIYPEKPRIGIRVNEPGALLHLDLSIIKLFAGTRCYIQAIVDNFSRYTLAWSVDTSYNGLGTSKLIKSALAKLGEFKIHRIPEVLVDSGSENLNKNVDELIHQNKITRTVAQIDVDFSNSMIEYTFRNLKHKHLYLHELSSLESLSQYTDFYFNETNKNMPLSVLGGATPLEKINGFNELEYQEKISSLYEQARLNRRIIRKQMVCGTC